MVSPGQVRLGIVW